MQLSAAELATGRWPGILAALGLPECATNRRHGPCPMCGGADRYRFDDKEGRGTWICSKCGAGDGYQLVQDFYGLCFKEAFDRVREVAGAVQVMPTAKVADSAKKVAKLRGLWNEALPLERGDPVWRYLDARIGISEAPHNIRHHPALPYYGDETAYYPGMVSAVTSPSGAGVSIHRTYLTADGQKARVETAKKLMPGLAIAGAAIRLYPAGEVMGVAEGIETAIAAREMFGVPVWSCISANGLISWEPPEGVRRVIVFGDCDASYTGQAAAFTLARRLVDIVRDVEVRIPERMGMDWADVRAEA